ncbi:MAG TPA: glucan biosynthesis protein [Candidatus Binatia bacterium]|nr:glucan biosynthesis protein [Candidatus Binatia bacterium]
MLVVAMGLRVPARAASFDLDTVAQRAAHLAAKPFHDPRGEVPDWLLKVTYDQWRDIRFRPDHALWRDLRLPFQVQFFHPGLYYDRLVKVNVVTPEGVQPVPFSPSQFDYGKNDFASRVPQKLGFAGFRIHYPIKRPDYYDEVIVFLGASYFRALGRDAVFGQSARGLAVDTAESRGEEFPYFREFWLVRPKPKDRQMTVYALLDSPSLTGAYRFVVEPGEQTVVRTACRLFLRREVEKLGIAPLTSMFLHGENTPRWFNDFRPEAHDTDGLLLNLANGEWLWRPLDNATVLNVNGFQAQGLRGFGLLQRDRDFDHYQDLETQAQRRPSVWIAPEGDWGAGRVELVEIPTSTDTNDNVVAYWVPAKAPRPGEPAAFEYTLHWYGDDPARPPGGRVVATRQDGGTGKDTRRFVIDFASKQLAAIPADRVLRGVVTVLGGNDVAEVVNQQVVSNPFVGGWRLAFEVRPKKHQPIELRAFLDENGSTLTETWSYVMLP